MKDNLMLHDYEMIIGREKYVNIEIKNAEFSTATFITPKSFFQTIPDDEFNTYKIKTIPIFKSFFSSFLEAIREWDEKRLEEIRLHLHEPKYVSLGYGRTKNGTGFEKVRFTKLCESIRRSEGFKTGLIRDITDLSIFCRGIGDDLISDLITNLIFPTLSEITHNELVNSGLSQYTNTYTDELHSWDENSNNWNASSNKYKCFTYLSNRFFFTPLSFCLTDFLPGKLRHEYFKNYIIKAIVQDSGIETKKLTQKKAIDFYCSKYLNYNSISSSPNKEQFLYMVDTYSEFLAMISEISST